MFTLLPLPYNYSALEPWIDAKTMEIHHTKHHQAYIDNLNKVLEGHPDLQKMSEIELLKNLDTVSEEIRARVRNNLGGMLNHNFFWQIMSPTKQEIPEKFNGLIDPFTAAAVSIFGSGWAWIVKSDSNQLEIITTPNQDSPMMQNKTPVLGLDVWEHAYYLKYQNRRADYVKAWWNVVNWANVTSFSR